MLSGILWEKFYKTFVKACQSQNRKDGCPVLRIVSKSNTKEVQGKLVWLLSGTVDSRAPALATALIQGCFTYMHLHPDL